MFHACFDLCVVYGVGVCVEVCDVVCVERNEVIQRAWMSKLGALEHVCRGFFCSSTSTCGVFCGELLLLPLCLAANVPRAHTVETFPRGQ